MSSSPTTNSSFRTADAESRLSKANNGNTPANSDVSDTKSHLDTTTPDKSTLISSRQSALPLPDEPPVPSDWNSADGSKVNVGSGAVEGDVSYGGDLRGPVTGESGVRVEGGGNSEMPGAAGREGKEGLEGLPGDAVKR